MLNKEIEALLVDQINFEISSAYLYLAMASYCDSIDMPGFANWFKVQWEEEIFHAMKMYNYVIDSFKAALGHEQKVTARINNIMTAAVEVKDHATISFLNWFIDEQVEEESNVDNIIKQLKMVGPSGHGLFMLDKEMKTRAFTPPVK